MQSILGEQITNLINERDNKTRPFKNEIKIIEVEYNSKINKLKRQCTHKYDDGTSAISRSIYVEVDDWCKICKEDIY